MEPAITAIVPDCLYRVGCTIPLENLSWAADRTGYCEPLNCYVILDGEDALFIDAGPPVAEQAVRTALQRLVGRRRISVFPTRNEADCIGNLGVLLAEGREARLLFGGGGGILEWINNPGSDLMETDNFLGKVPIVPAPNGTALRLGESTHLEFIDAPVKQMLLTQWAYCSTSRTLFTSDFFAWNHQQRAGDPPVVLSGAPSPTVEELAGEIERRVNWLRNARAPHVIRSLDAVFSDRRIDHIAPVHGCVISGADAVEAQLGLAREALALLLDERI